VAFELGSGAARAGFRLVEFAEAGSTNQEAIAAARAGDAGRCWFVTMRQTAGRGRRGRDWKAPDGNLAATLLLRVPHDPMTAATLGFVAGLSLDEALRTIAPGRADRLRLKWPNDVLLDGGKLAGILLEAEPLTEGGFAVAIGIGVNVVAAPEGLPYPAASLSSLGYAISAPRLFVALADAFASVLRVWDEGRGFASVRRLWLDRAAGLGEDVAVRIGDRIVSGVFETIDEEGRLVIRSSQGKVRTVAAGEVHFGAVASAN